MAPIKCPTCHATGGFHGGHCPNSGLPVEEWTTHEQRRAGRLQPTKDRLVQWFQDHADDFYLAGIDAGFPWADVADDVLAITHPH